MIICSQPQLLQFILILLIDDRFEDFLHCSSIHCGNFDTFQSKPKTQENTQVVIIANFHSLPGFIRHETHHFQKSQLNTLLTSSMVLHTLSSEVKQKWETSRGFQCCVESRAYSQLAEYQHQVGFKEEISLLLLHWCLKGVCTQVCHTLLFRLMSPELHFYRSLSQHVCRWITVVIRDRPSCCNCDNNSYIDTDRKFPSERKTSIQIYCSTSSVFDDQYRTLRACPEYTLLFTFYISAFPRIILNNPEMMTGNVLHSAVLLMYCS